MFRELEKLQLKLVCLVSHRTFNETCLNNDLLPTYTNIRLHDEAARTKEYVLDFRRKILSNEIQGQTIEISEISRELIEKRTKFKEILDSDIKLCAFESFLDRIITTKRISLEIVHQHKLTRLYHGEIFLKDGHDSVINLSSCNIDESLKRVFNFGMNCHLKTKYYKLRKQI